MYGNDKWEFPVNDWDRATVLDYTLMESNHESVQFIRDRAMKGEMDDMPMTQVVTYARLKLEGELKAAGRNNYQLQLASTAVVKENERLRQALREILLHAHETIPPDGPEAAYAAIEYIGRFASETLTKDKA